MISDNKFIHSVSSNNIAFYKKLCPKNSFYFSNSEAFVNSYSNSIAPTFCYNDRETIFFFGHFSDEISFICCPKGKNIELKIVKFLSRANRKKYKLKKIWFFEIPELFSRSNFNRCGLKEWKITKLKRPLLPLEQFTDLQCFLKSHWRLRKKNWNYFFNFLKKKEDIAEVVLKKLSHQNFQDAHKIIDLWYENVKNKQHKAFLCPLTPKKISIKNQGFIKNALINPNLYKCFIFYCNKIPRGIVGAFRIEKSLNLSSSVLCTDRHITGCTDVLYLMFLQLMAKRGYKLINLGNSYTYSLNRFKQKFDPDKDMYDTAYEYLMSF